MHLQVGSSCAKSPGFGVDVEGAVDTVLGVLARTVRITTSHAHSDAGTHPHLLQGADEGGQEGFYLGHPAQG